MRCVHLQRWVTLTKPSDIANTLLTYSIVELFCSTSIQVGHLCAPMVTLSSQHHIFVIPSMTPLFPTEHLLRHVSQAASYSCCNADSRNGGRGSCDSLSTQEEKCKGRGRGNARNALNRQSCGRLARHNVTADPRMVDVN